VNGSWLYLDQPNHLRSFDRQDACAHVAAAEIHRASQPYRGTPKAGMIGPGYDGLRPLLSNRCIRSCQYGVGNPGGKQAKVPYRLRTGTWAGSLGSLP
jgi:hypothetical protein